MKLIPLLMILTGVILIYSAKKNEDPRNVIYEALGIKRRVASPGATVGGAAGDAAGKIGEKLKTIEYPTNPPGTKTVSV